MKVCLKSTDELNFLSSNLKIVQPAEVFQYIICGIFAVKMSIKFNVQCFTKVKLTWARVKIELPFFSPWLSVVQLEHHMAEY